ncbi:MAG TPA: ATP-binding cassette domain-containing protein [Candidatus Scatomorpha intestinavium]|uniref:ATP-binding cassette domain-containing protein n=1 Tax=Candidatus Scatomorpha intestinavium TaxID=2840922 RepID=A0A9D1CSY5_9FIRM|nr:ATP-binding cassette domain-containing protein [Candidatus Scatomorpha intestinavium]
MPELLKVEHLKKYFKTPRGMLHAVDDVSFSVDTGTTLGVVGESGCGKSTLGRVVIKLLEPTAGTITFEGEDITKMKSSYELHSRMQMIFQDPYASLDPRMSVSEIIAEPLKIHKLCKSREELDERIRELMDTVGLAERFATSYPHELDGGRRQRIGIARALALKPKFIVCDEPVSALDVSIQAQILNLMQDLQERDGYTYMFITHDLSVVKHISNEILVMYLGQAVEKSGSDELFDRPLHPYTKALLAAIPEPVVKKDRHRELLKGEIVSPIAPKPGCRFAARCPYATEQCHSVNPELQEISPGHFVSCHRVKEIN